MSDLRRRVAARFDPLGLPSWPNPHADGAPARDEEYSRVTDPARYAIVHARARAWVQVLGELPGVSVEQLEPGGVRITPPTPGMLPLVLTPGLDTSLAVLHISVERPEIEVAVLPDCGCDACDWGSDDLLTAIDDTIDQIISGPSALVRGDGWQARWYPDGGSSNGVGIDHGQMVELCRRLAVGEDVPLPAGAEAFVGQPWFA